MCVCPALSCVLCCEDDAMSNPAVEVEDVTTPADDVSEAVPSVRFVSGFDNDDDNIVQRATDVSDADAGEVDEQMPLVAAAAESVCIVCTTRGNAA